MSTKRTPIDWDNAKNQLQKSEVALERALTADAKEIEELYQRRATELAIRNLGAKADVAATNVLVFSLGEEAYGIPIASLSEVLPFIQCTPVPRAAPELAGVINLRGELRSVIDLRTLLSLPATVANLKSQILMLKSGTGSVGLRVGLVDKVLEIRKDELVSPEAGSGDSSSSYFQGLIPGKVIVINVAALLSHPVFKTSSL